MSEPSQKNKTIAKSAAAAFGGTASVFEYWDARDESKVGILSCVDSPCEGVTSYSTIGVSDVPLFKDGKELTTRSDGDERPVRAELVGACASQTSAFSNCLGTAAFCVINSRWFVAPGVIFPEVVARQGISTTMSHLLWVPPFVWDDRLRTLNLPGLTVAWLLAVPISEPEMQFAERRGPRALEELFEKHQIDLFDVNRSSVL